MASKAGKGGKRVAHVSLDGLIRFGNLSDLETMDSFSYIHLTLPTKWMVSGSVTSKDLITKRSQTLAL